MLILQLAAQSGFIITGDKIHFDEGNNAVTSCPEAHEFADLIIDECIKAVKAIIADRSLGYELPPQDAKFTIKQHFNTACKGIAVFVIAQDSETGLYAATTRPYDKDVKIGLPGGKVENGESLRAAAVREAYEGGWEVTLDDCVPFHTDIVQDYTVHWFKAKDPKMLTEYKEKSEGIEPFLATYENIFYSGYGNDCISKLKRPFSVTRVVDNVVGDTEFKTISYFGHNLKVSDDTKKLRTLDNSLVVTYDEHDNVIEYVANVVFEGNCHLSTLEVS